MIQKAVNNTVKAFAASGSSTSRSIHMTLEDQHCENLLLYLFIICSVWVGWSFWQICLKSMQANKIHDIPRRSNKFIKTQVKSLKTVFQSSRPATFFNVCLHFISPILGHQIVKLPTQISLLGLGHFKPSIYFAWFVFSCTSDPWLTPQGPSQFLRN